MPYKIRDEAVAIRGLSQIQQALRKLESDAAPELKAALKEIGEEVLKAARGFITHESGRHGKSGPRLSDSLRVSATTAGASVYSRAEHGGVQNVGGKIGRNHSTLLKRAEVSQYMIKGVQKAEPDVERKINAVLDDLLNDFERGA